MRKLYSIFTIMVLGLLGFTAAAQDVTLTLRIDDPSRFQLFNNNYEEVELVAGDNILTAPEYSYFNLQVAGDEYYIKSITVNGEEETLYNRSNYSIGFTQGNADALIEVTSGNIAESRTAKCTVKTDNPEGFKIYFQSDYYQPELTGEVTEVAFSPEFEQDWVVMGPDYAELYKVTLNGEEIPYSQQYYVYDVTDGAVLEVTTAFPEDDVPVHFALTDEQKGLIVGVTVNNVEVDNYLDEDFSVQTGSRLMIYTNPNWDINGVSVNGVAQYFYAGMTFTVKEETTFAFAGTAKETYVVNVNVDDPKAVNLYLGGSYAALPTKLSEGDNKIEVSEYLSLQFIAKEGYLITEATCTKADGEVEDVYVSAYHEASTTYYVDNGECTYSVKTGVLADLRTAHATINIDKPEDVSVYMLLGSLNLKEGANEISFAPGIETELTIAPREYGQSIYKVTVNGEAVQDLYGQYEINLQDGDVVDITVAFPEGSAAVNFSFADEESKAFISEVTVDGEPVSGWDEPGFELPLGSRLEISGNTADYKLDNLIINGNHVTDNFYGSYTLVIDGETDIFVRAHKYGVTEFSIDVTVAEAVKVFAGNAWEPYYIDLQDGENAVSVSEVYQEINIVANDGYTIEGVYVDGEEMYEGWAGYTIDIKAGIEVVIAAKAIVYDQRAVVYSDCAEPYSFAIDSSDRKSPIDSNEGKYTVGYNTMEFFASQNPFSLRCYWSGDELPYVYLNNVDISDQAGYRVAGGLSLDELEIGNGDVLKVYTQGEPSMYYVTFAGNVEAAAIVADCITEVTDTELQALTGTQIAIASAEGQAVTGVKVNGAEQAPVDGVYYITVEADTEVMIIADTTALGSIGASMRSGDVYNTQGMLIMRGANAAQIQTLPAGLYIIDGKKVMKK